MNLCVLPARAARRGRRLTALLIVLAAASALGAAPASAAPSPGPTPSRAAGGNGQAGASRNATFGLQPVTNGRVDGRASFTYQTGPGGAYQDSFAVVNYGTRPLTLAVYAADLTNNSSGGLAVGSASDAKTGAAAWIRLPNGLTSVRIPAATAKGPSLTRIPFAWAVPASAAAGDHTAAIVGSLSVAGRGKDGNPVRLDQRIALRVFFRVGGAVAAKLSVTDLKVTYSGTATPTGGGDAQVTYTLRNTGNVRLGARQTLTSSAWLGAGGTPDPIKDQPLLLPGAAVHVSTAVHHVFPGLRLTEKLHVVPVRAPDDVNVSAKALDVEASTWAIPWTLIAGVLVLLALVVLLVLWRRKRRRSRSGPRHGRGRGDGPGPDGRGPSPDGGPEPAGGPGATALAGRTGDAR